MELMENYELSSGQIKKDTLLFLFTGMAPQRPGLKLVYMKR